MISLVVHFVGPPHVGTDQCVVFLLWRMQSGLADHVKWQITKTEYELYIPLSDLSLSGSVGKFFVFWDYETFDSTSKQTVCLYWKIILAQYRGLDANIGPGCHSLVSGQACWLSISSAQKMAEWFVNSVEHCFTFYCFDHYTPEKPWIPLQRTISPSRWILIGGSFPISLHCLSLRLKTCFSSVDHRVVSHWAIKTLNWSIIYIATVLWSSFAVSMNIILILELLFFQHESCQVQGSCGGWYRRRHARILCWILRRIIFKTSNDGLGSLIILTPFLLKMRKYFVFCFVCYCMLFGMVKYSTVWLVFDDCIGHHNSPITHLCMWIVIGF